MGRVSDIPVPKIFGETLLTAAGGIGRR